MPAVRFDGNNDFMTAPNVISGGQGRTIYLVSKPEEYSMRSMLDLTDAASGNGTDFTITPEVVARVLQRQEFNQRFATTGFQILTMAMIEGGKIGDIEGWLDGERMNGNPSATLNINTTAGNTLIGKSTQRAIPNYKGDHAEILIFDRYLLEDERQRVEGYLASKYGLESNLPESHPYKGMGNFSNEGISIDEDATLFFGSQYINKIAINSDAGEEFNVTTRLNVLNGKINLSGTNNLDVTGDGTSNVTITGSVEDINIAFDGMMYIPETNYYGDETLQFILEEEGGGQLATSNLSITVNSINDPPAIYMNGNVLNSLSPDSIDGLKLWLAADEIEDVEDGSFITVWNDSSGNQNDAQQSVSSNRPTYREGIINGLPVIRFNGNGDFLEAPSIIQGTMGRTVYIVAKTEVVNHSAILDLTNSFSGTATDFTITPEVYVRVLERQEFHSAFTTTRFHILGIAMMEDGVIGDIKGWLDGDEMSYNTTVTASINTSTGNTLIGKSAQSFPTFKGDYAEVLIFDRKLNAPERQNVEGYLAHKYGLIDNLPQEHQYKYSSPAEAYISTPENVGIVFSSIHNNIITVEDVDAEDGNITVELSLNNGTITLSTTQGLDVSGDGTSNLVLDGTLDSINYALDEMVYTPPVDFIGQDILAISVNDNGNTGEGGPMMTFWSIGIDVIDITLPQVEFIRATEDNVINIVEKAEGFHVIARSDKLGVLYVVSEDVARNLEEIEYFAIASGNVLEPGGEVIISIDENHERIVDGGVYVVYGIDEAGNISEKLEETFLAELTPPVGTISYNTTSPTNEDVVATLSIDKDGSTVTSEGGSTHTFTTNGSFTFEFMDVAGNTGSAIAIVSNIDTEAPTGTVTINDGDIYTTGTSVSLTVTNDGATQMRFSNDGETWSEWEAVAESKAWTLLGEDGLRTVYMELRDVAGNVASFNDSITYDATPPSGSITINAGDTYTTGTAVTLTVIQGGATEMRFRNDSGEWSGWEAVSENKAWTLVDIEGLRTVYMELVDAAGNVASFSDTITYDATPPSGTVAINDGATYTTGLDVILTVTNDGATQMRFKNDVGEWSNWLVVAESKEWTLVGEDGEKMLNMQLRDAAGNVSVTESDTIILDTTPPTISLSLSTTEPTNQDVTITATISPIGSNIEVKKWAQGNQSKEYFVENGMDMEATFDISTNGTYTVYARDEAGNEGVETIDVTNIDKDPPVISGVEVGNTYSSNVTPIIENADIITISKDGGLATSFLSGTELSQNGSYVIVATDLAGNSTIVSFTIQKPQVPSGGGSSSSGGGGSVYVPVYQNPVVRGVEDGGSYNYDLEIEILNGTGYLNNKFMGSNFKIIEDGLYNLRVKDTKGSTTHNWIFEIDRTLPQISNLEDGKNYNYTVSIAFNKGIAKLNGKIIENNYRVREDGKYELVVTDQAGNTNSVNFVIDTIPPLVEGVLGGMSYYTDRVITFNKGIATLNGEEFKSGNKVEKQGQYVLKVVDKAGNTTNVSFEILKEILGIEGVKNGGVYEKGIVIKALNGKVLLNGNEIRGEVSVDTLGTHIIKYKGETGEFQEISFTIVDTEVKELIKETIKHDIEDSVFSLVKGVEDGGYYSYNPRISFIAETAVLNGKEIANGTIVTEEGEYTLIVTDFEGNKMKLNFVVKKTSPQVHGLVDNGVYTEDINVEFDVEMVTLNGKLISNGEKIIEEGLHYITLRDNAGNITEKKFVLFRNIEAVEKAIKEKPTEKLYYDAAGKIMSRDGELGIKVYVEGKRVDFKNYDNVEPRIENGRTLVPIRAVAESMGAEVKWDGENQIVDMYLDGKEIDIKINSSFAMVGGEKVELDAPARIINGRTVVPIRFIAESLGMTLNWKPFEGSLSIISVY